MITIKPVHYDKQERYKEALLILDTIGAEYTKYNQGNHIVIDEPRGEIHYWPTTGKWRIPSINKSSDFENRFISGILEYLGEEYDEL